MVNIKDIRKGQGLPLNTIVIAILVIIVLLVIIVFFTTKMGDTGNTFNDNDATACSLSNPAISALGYKDVEWYSSKENCEDSDGSVISVIPKNDDDEICCGTKNNDVVLSGD